MKLSGIVHTIEKITTYKRTELQNQLKKMEKTMPRDQCETCKALPTRDDHRGELPREGPL